MNTILRVVTLVSLGVLGIAGCGRPEPQPQPTPEPEPPAAATTTAPVPSPAASMPRSPSPAGARVTFVSPHSGATVRSPVTIQFALEGMTLAPAGTNEPNTGHHHVLIDTGLPALDQPIPADASHVHFGKAQMEGQVELAPGPHTLQLLLGDGNHVPHDPPVASEQITITVE
jgi:hypothetical protein